MSERDAGKGSILIVDDSRTNRLVLVRLLEAPGRRIIEASSGPQALDILLNEHVDLVLLDIEMPEMDGFQTAEIIRGNLRFSHVPIIFQSAHGTDSRVIKGYALGAVDFIQKPIIPEILRARVEVFLSVQQKTAEILRQSGELRDAYDRLERAGARSHVILETATDGIVTFSENGAIETLNPAAERIFGYSVAALTGSPSERILREPATDASVLGEPSESSLACTTREVVGIQRGGARIPISLSISHVESLGERFYSATMRDLTEARKTQERLLRLAQSDHLTGLANRVTFEDRAEQFLAHAQRYGENGALIYLDLDGFKKVNDSSGQLVGDLLLLAVSHRLVDLLRDTDVIARVGGDEFCVLVDHLAEDSFVMVIARRIVTGLNEPFDLDGEEIQISASVGIALLRQSGESQTDLTFRAEAAMHASKRLGGNRATLSTVDDSLDPKAIFVEQVEKALESPDALTLFYEPIVDLKRGHTTGYQAHLRWNREEQGLTAPGDLIQATETDACITAAGRWIVQRAIRRAAMWPRGYPELDIDINLSIIQFLDPALPDNVSRCAGANAFGPRRVRIGVSATSVKRDTEAIRAAIAALREVGVQTSLNGFGLTDSPRQLLEAMPFDVVRIDRSLVSSMDSPSRELSALIEAIVRTAHLSGRLVIADGVETHLQQERAAALGCDRALGRYFGLPVADPFARVWSR